MANPTKKYIILHDHAGRVAKSTAQVKRGELLEAASEADQPSDINRISLVGIECTQLNLECLKDDVAELSDKDFKLLLAISSDQSRYETFIEKTRMTFGREISSGSAVLVSGVGLPKDEPGIVRYKGELQPNLGTWFGIELIVSIS